MHQNNTIEHSGVVQSVEEKSVNVRIVSHPSCAGCAATNICDVSGMSEKVITTLRNVDVKPGERVTVIMSQSQGYRALFLGYLFPFLIVLVLLIVLISAGLGELYSGLISLGSLVPYYLVVWLRRENIGKSFSFSIKKQI